MLTHGYQGSSADYSIETSSRSTDTALLSAQSETKGQNVQIRFVPSRPIKIWAQVLAH